MDIRIEFYDSDGFGLVTCPHCGKQENLDCTIEDNWECPYCDKEYWITPARIITASIPNFEEHGFERRMPIKVRIERATIESDAAEREPDETTGDPWQDEVARRAWVDHTYDVHIDSD